MDPPYTLARVKLPKLNNTNTYDMAASHTCLVFEESFAMIFCDVINFVRKAFNVISAKFDTYIKFIMIKQMLLYVGRKRVS